MRRKPLSFFLFLFLCGCKSDPLDFNPKDIPADELAKRITMLWENCRDAIERYRAVPKTERKRRVEILEKEAYPYGKRGFEVAPLTAHQTTIWFARAATFLGWEYDIWGQELIGKADDTGDDSLRVQGEKYREKGKRYMKEGLRALLHYERVYYDRNPIPEIYYLMEITYELLGDRRSAYLVSLKWLSKLKGLAKQSPGDRQLNLAIERWRTVIRKLRKLMIQNLEPIPEDPYGVLE